MDPNAKYPLLQVISYTRRMRKWCPVCHDNWIDASARRCAECAGAIDPEQCEQGRDLLADMHDAWDREKAAEAERAQLENAETLARNTSRNASAIQRADALRSRRDAVQRMRASGMTLDAIAAIVNVADTTIRRDLAALADVR